MNPDRTVCVYEAASNNDANLLAMFLNDEGIEALAVEDNSLVGLYAFGSLPGIHRPKVFVHRDDAQIAREMIARFEKKQPVSGEISDTNFCYHCGAECKPDTDTCVACGQTLDQADEPDDRDLSRRWANLEDQGEAPAVRGFRKPVGMLPLLAVIIILCMIAILCFMSSSHAGGRAVFL